MTRFLATTRTSNAHVLVDLRITELLVQAAVLTIPVVAIAVLDVGVYGSVNPSPKRIRRSESISSAVAVRTATKGLAGAGG